jgi:hypothetical protein
MYMRITLLVLIVVCLIPDTASAYVGPGAGLSVIGAAFALIAGAFLAVVGFVWYPIKRLLRFRRRVRSPENASMDTVSR